MTLFSEEIKKNSGESTDKNPLFSIFWAFFIGLCGGVLFWSYYRVFTVKFPLNFVNPQLMVVALSGLAMGMVSARKRIIPRVPLEFLLAIGLVVFVLANLLYKDSSIHFLLFSLYYKYPAPSRVVWVMAGHIMALLLSPLPFFILSRNGTFRLRSNQWSTPACLIGTGAGLILANASIPLAGGYSVFIAGCIATCLLIRRRILAVACAALIVAEAFLLAHPEEAFYTWQIRDYNRLDSFWTPYYKADYLEFENGHCLACVQNMIVVSYVCDDPDKLMTHYKNLSRVLSQGDIPKTRVLSVGRTNGHLPLAMKLENPNLERLMAVEYDPRVTQDFQSLYAKYNDHIFAEKGFDSLAQDIRYFLKWQNERFDVVYINGAGIMLFFYPLTFITQEDYLFSINSYDQIFNQILTEDGILIIDRGSSMEMEVYKLAGSVPDDVRVRSFWTKIPDFPFTGLPLSYVIASRNESELNRIAEKLTEGNLFNEIPYHPSTRRKWSHTDNIPFLQPTVALMLTLLTIPFLIYLVLLTLRLRIRHKHVSDVKGDTSQGEGSESFKGAENVFTRGRRDIYLCIACGAISAVILLLLTTYGSRVFASGAPFGFVLTFSLFLLSAAAMLSMIRFLSSKEKTTCWLGLGALGLAFVFLSIMPLHAEGAIFSAILGGAAVAVFARLLFPLNASSDKLQFFIVGLLFGILLFQWAIYFLGFWLLAAALLLLLFVSIQLRFRKTPVCIG